MTEAELPNSIKQTAEQSVIQTPETLDTLPKVLMHNYLQWGDRSFMRKKKYGIWKVYDYNECYRKIKLISLGLVSLGLEAGEKASILGDSSPEWFWSQLSIQAGLGVSVGLMAENSPEEIKYVLEHSESKFVVVEDQEQVDKVLQIKHDLPLLRKVIYWDEKGLRNYDDPDLISLAELIRLGEDYEKSRPGCFEQNIARGSSDDLYSIQYTSGTTGLPKGAMMTYRKLFAGQRNGQVLNPAYEGDEWLSITLPAWGVEQTFGLFDSLTLGQRFNFAEKPETISRDLREVAPHRILYPSMMWERLASSIQTGMEESTWLKRMLFKLILPIGYKMSEFSLRGRRPNILWKLLGGVAELALFRPLRDKHGITRVRVPFTAGAMLSPDVIKFLRAIGLNLRQYYGSTEAGALSVHTADDFKFESVGVVHLGRTIRITDKEEILADKEGAFDGYYRNPDATEQSLSGGWYHTGDAGHIDEDGHLIFIDRLKDMRQLRDGTRFSPQYIESRLKFSPYIKDVIVLGSEERDFITAIINIDFANTGHWADRKGINYTTFTDLSQKPEVVEFIRKEVEKVNRSLPANSRVRSFVSLPKEFDPDEAEMTRTRKLRRGFIEDRYRELAEAMYGKREEIVMESSVTYRDGRTSVVSTKIGVIHLQD